MQEIWKPVVGYEGLYEVSNLGRLKSLLFNKEKIIKINQNANRYYVAEIWKNRRGKFIRIHRLVAETFIPNPQNKSYVNHIDNNPKNNTVSNLEWCSQKENIQHAVRQNRMVNGVRSPLSKLKEKDVLFIRDSKLKQKELAKIYSISQCNISLITNKKRWKTLK